LIDDTPYHTHELTVDAGDRVLLFTDGLFEVENAQEQSFSESRLREVIRRHACLPLDKMLQDTSREIKDFAQDQVFTDDVCLVGVEITRLETQVAEVV
jgi:sigma-B regulation protein RsbU (phosphoserine phosphatase)